VQPGAPEIRPLPLSFVRLSYAQASNKPQHSQSSHQAHLAPASASPAAPSTPTPTPAHAPARCVRYPQPALPACATGCSGHDRTGQHTTHAAGDGGVCMCVRTPCVHARAGDTRMDACMHAPLTPCAPALVPIPNTSLRVRASSALGWHTHTATQSSP